MRKTIKKNKKKERKEERERREGEEKGKLLETIKKFPEEDTVTCQPIPLN